MAKTPKPKPKSTVNPCSRVSGHQPSPLLHASGLPRPASPTILAPQSNTGIQKKKSKAKPLSRAKRLRYEKGMQRAEAVTDQLEVKATGAKRREKGRRERRRPWGEVNEDVLKSSGQMKMIGGAFGVLAMEVRGGDNEGEQWEDVDTGDLEIEGTGEREQTTVDKEQNGRGERSKTIVSGGTAMLNGLKTEGEIT